MLVITMLLEFFLGVCLPWQYVVMVIRGNDNLLLQSSFTCCGAEKASSPLIMYVFMRISLINTVFSIYLSAYSVHAVPTLFSNTLPNLFMEVYKNGGGGGG